MLPRPLLLTCLIALGLLSLLTEAAPISTQLAKLEPRRLAAQCQAPKSGLGDPLAGCPAGTIFVSPKHPKANFQTINAALNSLADDGSTSTILIDEGVYHEKVIVGRLSPTVFAGVTPNIRDPASNRVTIWQSTFVNQSDPHNTLTNCDATVLGVGTGAPVGTTDFKAYNIDFTQRQFQNGKEVTQTQLGPAAALCVQSSNASFYGCSFNSYQDTVFVGSNAQAFFYKSIVRGMTDQLYGSGKAWFEQVTLLSRACVGGITAWRGDPNDPLVGVYVSNSNIDKSSDASTLKPMEDKCHLGRPWNVYSHSVYLNTKMSDIIADAGFEVWGKKASNFDPKTTRFAEYGSSGRGGDLTLRDKSLGAILTKADADKITYQNVFGGKIGWIDADAVKSW